MTQKKKGNNMNEIFWLLFPLAVAAIGMQLGNWMRVFKKECARVRLFSSLHILMAFIVISHVYVLLLFPCLGTVGNGKVFLIMRFGILILIFLLGYDIGRWRAKDGNENGFFCL